MVFHLSCFPPLDAKEFTKREGKEKMPNRIIVSSFDKHDICLVPNNSPPYIFYSIKRNKSLICLLFLYVHSLVEEDWVLFLPIWLQAYGGMLLGEHLENFECCSARRRISKMIWKKIILNFRIQRNQLVTSDFSFAQLNIFQLPKPKQT